MKANIQLVLRKERIWKITLLRSYMLFGGKTFLNHGLMHHRYKDTKIVTKSLLLQSFWWASSRLRSTTHFLPPNRQENKLHEPLAGETQWTKTFLSHSPLECSIRYCSYIKRGRIGHDLETNCCTLPLRIHL